MNSMSILRRKALPSAPSRVSVSARIASALWLLVMFMAMSAHAAENPVIFTGLITRPDGIATDPAGNVFIHGDGLYTSSVAKFGFSGKPVGWSGNIGGIIPEFIGSHLATSPISNEVLLLSKTGQLLAIDQNSLQVVPTFVDLRPNAGTVISDPSVYNTLTGEFGALALGAPDYGDFAVRKLSDTRLEFFFSAVTQTNLGSLPFVLRVRADIQSKTLEPKVVMMARRNNIAGFQTAVLNLKTPTGIAVNIQGKVLTTFPFPIAGEPPENHVGGFPLGVLSFNAGFPEDGSKPQFMTKSGKLVDLDSFGMTTDGSGNFYVVTGEIGTTSCSLGLREAALVVIPSTVDSLTCFRSGVSNLGAADVALSTVSAQENAVYMSLFGQNAVLRYIVAPPVSNLTPTSTSTSTLTPASTPPPPPTPTSAPTPPPTSTPTSGFDLSGQWVSNAPTQKCRSAGSNLRCRVSGTFLVRNRGSQTTPKTRFTVFVSGDTALDGNDPWVKDTVVRKIRKSLKLKLKANLSTGSNASGSYLIGVIDANNLVPENNETNNTAVFGPLR